MPNIIVTASRDRDLLIHAKSAEDMLDHALAALQRMSDENSDLHRQIKRNQEAEEHRNATPSRNPYYLRFHVAMAIASVLLVAAVAGWLR